MSQSSEDNVLLLMDVQIIEIFFSSNIPLRIEEDLISCNAEEWFILFNFLSVMDVSVAVTALIDEIGEDIVFGLIGFVVVAHPMCLFIDDVTAA